MLLLGSRDWAGRLGALLVASVTGGPAVNRLRTREGGFGEMSVDSSACLRRLPPFLLFLPPSIPRDSQRYFLQATLVSRRGSGEPSGPSFLRFCRFRAAWRTATSRRLQRDGDAGGRLRQWVCAAFESVISKES